MKRGISLAVIGLLVCAALHGGTSRNHIHVWNTDIYFGHVTYPDAKHDGKDAVVLREGELSPEIADLNLPIAPGDTIKTNDRRCEIQFDTGTIIRLDRNTELKIETILARSLSSKKLLTNLLLFKGQIYIMYKRYVRKEIFQIITPNTALKLNHNSVALIDSSSEGSTDIHMSEGKGFALYGPNENFIKRKAVKESQKIMVTPDHKAEAVAYEEIEDFEAWNEKLNREFDDFHEGKAVIPLPIQKMSKGVYYFAQKYSYLYGEWLWDKYLGYVWRPFLNDRSHPGGEWMPYYHGRWTSVQGALFWVPSEPWGWVPYHLGIWMWNKKKGWLWIPGSVFSPAWVDWSYHHGYFCWRPWSITDWYSYGVYQDGYFPYFAHLIHPDDDPFYIPDEREDASRSLSPEKLKAKQVITKEQLKKKEAPFPMPKEFKEIYKRVVIAMKDGEEEILDPLKETPSHMMVVSQKDLNAPKIQEKVVRLTSLSQDKYRDILLHGTQQEPHREAIQTYDRNEKITALRQKVTDMIRDLEGLKSLKTQEFQISKVIVDNNRDDSRNTSRKEMDVQSSGIPMGTSIQAAISPPERAFPSPVRFRDWNPDRDVARRAGISIRYSSRSNEVRCPELDISSRQVSGTRGYEGPRVHLTSRGTITAPGRGGGIASGGTSSGTVSSRGSSNAASSNQGDKNAASGGKSAVVKKKI